jgi:hypothetical protein
MRDNEINNSKEEEKEEEESDFQYNENYSMSKKSETYFH